MRAWGIAAVLCPLITAIASDVSGVGGFVRESSRLRDTTATTAAAQRFKLDYSNIAVELYSSDGVKLEETDCAPNGAYFFALDSSGTFKVQVHGPSGWTFSPNEALVMCESGECNGGNDVDFEHDAFAVHGQVTSSDAARCGSANFAERVTLTLLDNGHKVQQKQTTADGTFVFDGVLPGSYAVAAQCDSWNIQPAEMQVEVGFGTAQLPQSFVVHGYTLRGVVTSAAGSTARSVRVLLYTRDDVTVPCSSDLQAEDAQHDNEHGKLVCATSTDASGAFVFKNVPCGTYVAVPEYSNGGQAFSFQPASQRAVVRGDSLELLQKFSITGFALPGRVVSPSGTGIDGAEVLLNGRKAAVTDAEGLFMLRDLRDTSYTLSAAKHDMQFATLTSIQVNAGMQSLPDIKLSSIAACGTIWVADKSKFAVKRTIVFEHSDGSGPVEASSDGSGKFCAKMAPGEYRVTPRVSDAERDKGLAFGPLYRHAVLQDTPQHGLDFSQLRLTVKATIVCKAKCPEAIAVMFKSTLDSSAVLQFSTAAPPASVAAQRDGQHITLTIADVIPGSYELSAEHDGWCWTKDVVTIQLDSSDAEAPALEQAGWLLRLTLQHAANVTLRNEHSEQHHSMPAGVTSLCLPSNDPYHIEPHAACCEFAQTSYTHSPGDEVHLRVAKRRLVGTISMTAAAAAADAADVAVTIHPRASDDVIAAELQSVDTDDGHAALQYTAWPPAEARSATIKATNGTQLLIHPAEHTMSFDDTQPCLYAPRVFHASRAVYLDIATDPVVAGAAVRVRATVGGDAAAHVSDATFDGTTDASGKARVGPLHENARHDVTIDHEGFAFAEPSVDGTVYIFKAAKHVSVKVTTEVDGLLDSGVLLTLSTGAGFRKVVQTDVDGTFTFWKLQPGSYVLQPRLIEYKFEPAYQQFDLDQQDLELAFKAERVAYSLKGATLSLAGRPLEGVVVEATPASANAAGQRSAVSDASGSFAIRNLSPGVNYSVAVRSDKGVDRGLPASIDVAMTDRDVEDVKFAVLKSPSRASVSATVAVAEKYCDQVMIELWRTSSGGTEALVRSIAVDYSRYIDIVDLRPGSYVLRAACQLKDRSLSCSTHDLPVQAAAGYQHVGELMVDVVVDAAAAHEAVTSPIWVIVIILAIAAFAFRDKITKPFTSQPSAAAGADDWLPNQAALKRGTSKAKRA